MFIKLVKITKIEKLELNNFDLYVEATILKGIWPFQNEHIYILVYRFNPIIINSKKRYNDPFDLKTFYHSNGDEVNKEISDLIFWKLKNDKLLEQQLNFKKIIIDEIASLNKK